MENSHVIILSLIGILSLFALSDEAYAIGTLGSDHVHAAIIVDIFGDEFDFSAPDYQIKSSWIHFEGRDGTTIHRHATDVPLGDLFDSINIGISNSCYIFPDGRNFCTNNDYSLKFFVNNVQTYDLQNYVIQEGDNILITFDSDFSTSKITVSTDKASYSNGETILVTGEVSQLLGGYVISLTVLAPNGEIVALDQLAVGVDKRFSTSFGAGGNLMMEEGTYTITVQYGDSKSRLAETTFYFEKSLIRWNIGEVQWLEVSYPSSGSGVVRVIDLDMNLNPNAVDNFDVNVWSDSDARGIDLTVTETNENTGVFEGTVFFTTADESSGHRLRVVEGDTVTAEYGDNTLPDPYTTADKLRITAYVIIRDPTSGTVDDTPPKILQPKDITVRATDYRGAIVSYEVLAIDAEDEIVRPFCRPLSGSSFPIGETTVTCSASDSDGNSAREVSFTIIVKPAPLFIPDWIKEVAAFWCNDNIDDDAYIEGIQYLIDNEIIIVEATSSGIGGSQEIPSWVKNNACWWSLGSITDKDFTSGLEYLIGQGIIRV